MGKKALAPDPSLTLRIILETPPAGVDYGLQKGSGSRYETVQKQRSVGKDLIFEAVVTVQTTEDGAVIFRGPFVQSPRDNAFIYIDIGATAGQTDTLWSRRLKIPLHGIGPALAHQAAGQSGALLETRVPGTGKDGGPNCATVKPFEGFVLTKK